MNLMEAKIVAMSVCGLVSILVGMLPVLVVKKMGLTASSTSTDSMSGWTRALLSGILCFGGGVLMGTGFLHMLPEVHEGWENYMKVHDIDINLALGIVVICAGFFLVYFVEEVAHLVADRHAHNKTDVSLHRAVSIRGCTVSRDGPAPPCESPSCQPESEASCQDSTICQLDCEEKEFCREVSVEECSSPSKKCCSSKGTINQAAEMPVVKNTHNDSYGTFCVVDNDANHIDHDNQSEHERSQAKLQVVTCSSQNFRSSVGDLQALKPAEPTAHHGHHHHGLVMTADGRCVSASLRGLLVIIALSLHEILEGMALGLQKNQSGVLQLFAAVASHKFVISFCVGLELSTNGVRLLVHTIYILVFSLVTPLGIGIGVGLMYAFSGNESPAESLSSLILNGLACGTILYVAFFEILERERSKSTVGLFQWTLLLVGFLAILGLQTMTSETPSEAADVYNATNMTSGGFQHAEIL